jgi:hypothetical protein
MKRFKTYLLSFCAAAALTVVMASSAAASGGCLTSIQASDANGYFFCQLTSEDANWCYYSCEESGDPSALYAQFGLESY